MTKDSPGGRSQVLRQETPMLLERTLVYVYVVLFAISLLLEQPIALVIAS
jgi:hypothetical protein